MQLNDTMKGLKGHIKLELFDASGNLKDVREIDNVVVTVGKTFMAAWLAAASQADYFMKYMGLGEGLSAANASDTVLETPLPTRVIGAVTSASNVWQNIAVFGAGVNTGAVSEAGLFSAASGGTLMAHQVFGVITKAAGDSLQITWQITVS